MRSSPSRILVTLFIAVAGCNGTATGEGGAGGPPGAGPPAGITDPALVMIQAGIDAANVDRSKPGWRTALPRPAAVTFTSERTYIWTLSTSKGQMRLQLRPEVAPMHVTSTIYLTLLGFYDTLTFHRIVKGFMAQGGDPLGNGTGSPGYGYGVEVSAAARHDSRGVLSMANAGPNTEGSQFFVTFGPQPGLDGRFSVFGNLLSGSETLSAIEAAGTAGEGTPALVTIDSARVSVE
jgi:peptidyl-prolyl cis-trans isomerase B (cyclophilin B)